VSERGWIILAAIVALSLAFVVVMPIMLLTNAGTDRLQSCVEHGGSYVHVPNTDTYECQGAMVHE
jgi:hypothetical protein